jgi:uncharacterized protein YdiU (UPF0061 family)
MNLNEIQLINPYLGLPPLCYDKVEPTPLKKPFLIHANLALAKELDLDEYILESEAFVKFINGELKLKGSEPFAMCYAGHQFGVFVPRLGDGRVINIGTINHQHLQLKGSGQTRYSRNGDGRAVLRSSIREYLMSEAMHGLGIETTRALAIIGSEQEVIRENWEKASIVLRVSPSWIRFGTFEYFTHSNNHKELEALADYAIEECYPHLMIEDNRYYHFFTEVMGKTARLMAQWQSVGFNHGVMNTDNMSILGITIDYGPYAFLDDYSTNYICNHTDRNGRYSFGSQPTVGEWNLHALALALSPLVSKERLEKVISHYGRIYSRHFLYLMAEKLGFEHSEESDFELIKHLLGLLQSLNVDYTLFFRTVSRYDGTREPILKLGLRHNPMMDWLDSYDKRLEQNSGTTEERHAKMLKINPKFVLKNYILQEAIDQADKGDFSVVAKLFEIAQTPYDEHYESERWAEATPREFKNQKLSCSS